ncbi:MAG TPA: molybdenum cofactor guanylyltransferase [Myxococcaceae bacterium]|nr:molybdenum cofactor guanylyltransferase [Myxococcaceae bacterium]
MRLPEEGVTLAILAGGRARRLGGVPKGLLLREGRSLLAHLLELGPGFDEVLLVTPEAAPYQGFPVRTVADRVAGRGAPGGVHAALVEARSPWVLAVAADMPFVTRAVVDRLLAERGPEVDAVGFEVQGRLEPLLACYRTRAAEVFAAALADEPSFRDLWRGLRARVLSSQALAEVDPGCRSVVSINTPEDARAWGVVVPAPEGGR